MKNKLIFSLVLVAPIAGACGATFPPPTQRMADAQAAERSAREVGANDEPVAKLSLVLAQDQIARARAAMADGDNESADSLLIRAQADAELSIAQARAKNARLHGAQAREDSAAQREMNISQGATK